MQSIRFKALPTDVVRQYQAGQPDANDQLPEHLCSQGYRVPCRHCLDVVAEGDPFLVLAHRPFPDKQPYAELGPIFLHADGCEQFVESATLPPMLTSDIYILRGYDEHNRIIYDTAGVVPTDELTTKAQQLLTRADVQYLHVRSASANCYQCRIERA